MSCRRALAPPRGRLQARFDVARGRLSPRRCLCGVKALTKRGRGQAGGCKGMGTRCRACSSSRCDWCACACAGYAYASVHGKHVHAHADIYAHRPTCKDVCMPAHRCMYACTRVNAHTKTPVRSSYNQSTDSHEAGVVPCLPPPCLFRSPSCSPSARRPVDRGCRRPEKRCECHGFGIEKNPRCLRSCDSA